VDLMPDDFDIPELLCSPTEFSDYNSAVATPVLRDSSKK
jgi:hypothetical protein